MLPSTHVSYMHRLCFHTGFMDWEGGRGGGGWGEDGGR